MEFDFKKRQTEIDELIKQHGDRASLHITRMMEAEAFNLTQEQVAIIHKMWEFGAIIQNIAKRLDVPYSRVQQYISYKDLNGKKN